jgi:hypothetical protein
MKNISTSVPLGRFVVPTFRRVVKRRTDGPVIHGPTAVLIVISDVSLGSVGTLKG